METFIKNLARGAGKILREGFRKKVKVSFKGNEYDVVTKYDLAADAFIVNKIKKRFPNHGIISEESGDFRKKGYVWIIDPLDATHAFVRGIPQFSVSIALAYGKKLIHGAVYDPVADELFYAGDKRGAFAGRKQINTPHKENLSTSIVSAFLCTAGTTVADRRLVFDKVIAPNSLWIDKVASLALSGAYVAAGRYDIIIAKGCNSWDYAAAALILKEAGAKVTDFRGRNFKWDSLEMIASCPKIHREIIRQIN